MTQGLASDNAPKKGAPVLTGGAYNATLPSYDDGDAAALQVDSRGNLRVTIGSGASGVDVQSGNVDDGSAALNGQVVNARKFVFDGATWDRLRTPTTFKVAAAVAASAGTGVIVWTPAAGKKFRLMGYKLSSTAAASLIFCDSSVATVIFRSPIIAASGNDQVGAADVGNGILSASADRPLRIDASATTVITGTVWGTEE